MRFALLPAFVLAAAAMPAQATIGLLCTPTGRGPSVGIVFGAGADGGIAAVNLKEGAAWRSSFRKADGIRLLRSSSEHASVRVDFLDVRTPRRAGRLRARIAGHAASGTFALGRRQWPVRCIQD